MSENKPKPITNGRFAIDLNVNEDFSSSVEPIFVAQNKDGRTLDSKYEPDMNDYIFDMLDN